MCIVFALLLIVSNLSISVFAAEETQEIIHFDDGSYLVITIEESMSRASGTKTGTKNYVYYANNGDLEWKAVLRGTFTFTGTSAVCTASSCDVSITNTSWYVVSKTVSKSGNTAIRDLTMGLKTLGITMKKMPINMILSCDANGNLS